MKAGCGRRLGITVMPEYLQSEGVEGVLTNVADRLRATSVTTSPYIATECAPGTGFREPPEDAGAGKKRLLERPLWGKREVHMETAPSFAPNARLYSKTSYAPEAATDLTRSDGKLINNFLKAAKKRGLKTYLQVMAASPPCLRVQVGHPHPRDQPMLPNGRPLPQRVDRNASLASQDMHEYVRAMIFDLCQNYPESDGFKFDWPEYPPYHFVSLFADYNPQVAPYAAAIGIDLEALGRSVSKGCIDLKEIRHHWEAARDSTFVEVMANLRARHQAFDDHFRLRAHLVERYAAFLRECVDDASGGTKTIMLQGFPPPWNTLSGFDPVALKSHAHELAIKFYTMHWPMMGANYVEQVQEKFGLPGDEVASFFSRSFMGLTQGGNTQALVYPEPEMSHGISSAKIMETFAAFGDAGAVGITHSYGPCVDVVARCAALVEATHHNIEINRYAYLSEAKLDALSNLLTPLTKV